MVRVIRPGYREIIQAPTGAGKSHLFMAMIRWALENDMKVAIYCCRNLLIQQLIGSLEENGIGHGVISAQYPKLLSNMESVQLCSLDTVYARFDKTGVPLASLVIVDEAHQQKEQKAQKVLDEHTKKGACVIGFTATPVDCSYVYKNLYQAATNSELRSKDSGAPAHVPALVFGCPELDTRNISLIKTGEFSLREIRKSVWTPAIFGHVLENYLRLNKQRKPTILFAPGVAESKWFTDEFQRRGINAAHIDGQDCYEHGEEYRSNPERRQSIIDRLKDGEINIICNRFVMREGVDIPELAHLILACPMGSVVAYVQTVGRVMRSHPSLKHVVVQDHGGNWWRHGSPNEDRDWTDFFYMNVNQASSVRRHETERGERDCAIQCPQCGAIRGRGSYCHACGYHHQKTRRQVLMRNGRLIEMVGDPIPKIKIDYRSDTERIWKECYYRCKRAGMTFKQAIGLFVKENGYWPPENLGMMPRKTIQWWAKIDSIPEAELR